MSKRPTFGGAVGAPLALLRAFLPERAVPVVDVPRGATEASQNGDVAARRPAAERFYRPELDGLRFLAFFGVFVHHALGQDPAARWEQRGLSPELASWLAATLRSGEYGVDLFFCLSAFLITELLVREHARFGTVDAWRFWTRRALRIWPLYYAFLLVAAFPILGSVLTGSELAAFALFFANWQCAFHGYPNSFAAPLWSVAIEEQFYLVWPWIVRFLSPARLLRLSLGLVALAVTTRTILVAHGVEHPGIWCNTFARMDAIALGSMLALILRGRAPNLGRAARWALTAAAGVAIITVARFVPVSASVMTYDQVWAYLVVDLACAAILLATITDRPGPLGTAVPVYLGRISYGLYVWHALALKLAGPVLVRLYGGKPPLLRAAVGLAITLLLATTSYHVLERPFLRLKAKFAKIQSRPD